MSSLHRWLRWDASDVELDTIPSLLEFSSGIHLNFNLYPVGSCQYSYPHPPCRVSALA